MRRLIHWLVHRLHWQHGWPEVFTVEGRMYSGFMCATCGQMTSVHECPEWMQKQIEV